VAQDMKKGRAKKLSFAGPKVGREKDGRPENNLNLKLHLEKTKNRGYVFSNDNGSKRTLKADGLLEPIEGPD